MATATGTNVKFVKVQTKQQYNDYTDKDGALIFVENERKIYVDGVAYGFSDSDVANKFLELAGGTMLDTLDMGQNDISNIQGLYFENGSKIRALATAQTTALLFETGSGGEPILSLDNDNIITFNAIEILGIPEPAEDSSPISAGYLTRTVTDRIGVANGIAGLDNTGKVPSTQLPSYVDDVEEYAKKADFPATGESGKLYIDLSNGHVWRWGGSAYAYVADGNAHLTLGTTASTAYRGDYGNTAYNHSQLTGTNDNPHNITKVNVGLGNVMNYGLATTAQAKAGSAYNVYMTPSTTKDAIEALAPKLSWTVVS